MGKLNLEMLPDRDCPTAFLASSFQVAYQPGPTETLRVAVDDDFNGPTHVTAQPGGYFTLTGTVGVVHVVRFDGSRREVWDETVSPATLRTGVVVSPHNAIPVMAHATLPGDTATVRRNVDAIADGVAGFLAESGYRVVVYQAQAITALPEFASLKGEPIGQAGSGGRTWDQVTAATDSTGTYLTPKDADRVIREAFVFVYFKLSTAERGDWHAAWMVYPWDEPVLAANEIEAFAESGMRYTISGADVGGYFQSLYFNHGW